jgi:DNA-binding response OmpR family regulator
VNENKLRLLLVERDARYREVHARALALALEADVETTDSGVSALAHLAAAEPPALVVLDHELGDIPAQDMLRRARLDARLSSVAFIVRAPAGEAGQQLALLESGADDFIEYDAAPEILLARIKAQLRHKLAMDRLTHLALDRDLFAAGVLQDIGAARHAIVAACRSAKSALQTDPTEARPAVLATLAQLHQDASRLGAYASDIIQSVRDTAREPKLAPVDLEDALTWVDGVLALGAAERAPVALRRDGAFVPVLADRTYLRMALLNVAQHVSTSDVGAPSGLAVSQTLGSGGPNDRPLVVTRVAWHEGPGGGGTASPASLAAMFTPFRGGVDQTGRLTPPSLELTLVAKVLAKMGGRAYAEGAPDGHGVVFCLALAAT